ncbi:MAG: hypothetical protein HY076_06335 [Candidatus Eisenbacteria bacterium]|uniref:Uncharacterized protein n=1 Tax=Eiseniibacteriota bacterium TaxID=2212470 RepID=A0A9D6QML0_UNCEI|nr:hypothetical protein [Candidatus Eisenbacteria bacterium]MBI3539873.1 hypothetical protein [Candidatus Eisenbacteria bacterium]
MQPTIGRDGSIRLRVTVNVLAPGTVKLEADAHWPMDESRSGRPENETPPIRWWGRDEVSRGLPIGRRTIDLNPRLRRSEFGAPRGIGRDSLYILLSRNSALGVSQTSWWYTHGKAAGPAY